MQSNQPILRGPIIQPHGSHLSNLKFRRNNEFDKSEGKRKHGKPAHDAPSTLPVPVSVSGMPLNWCSESRSSSQTLSPAPRMSLLSRVSWPGGEATGGDDGSDSVFSSAATSVQVGDSRGRMQDIYTKVSFWSQFWIAMTQTFSEQCVGTLSHET